MIPVYLRPLIVVFILLSVISCNKKDDEVDPIPPENKQKAAELEAYLETNKFQLTDYYSETPIDYIDTDQVVKSETDLWQYVSLWIKDDRYSFNTNGEVSIEQNTNKIQTDSTPVLTRNYSVEPDKDGVGFNFVGHEYQALKYRLITFSDTLLKVNAQWNGKTVISEYRVIP